MSTKPLLENKSEQGKMASSYQHSKSEDHNPNFSDIPVSTNRRSVADGISRTDQGLPGHPHRGVLDEHARPTDDNTEYGADAHLPDPDRPMLVQSHAGEFNADHGTILSLPRSVFIFAGCAALNSCNLGYDIGVNTSAAEHLQRDMDLSDVQLELFMGSLNLFAMIGALASNVISDMLGRRGAFMAAAAGFIIGVVFECTSYTYTMLMVGRCFVGLGVGFGLAVDPIYISEIAPAAHRGKLVTWSEIATNIGIVFGFMAGLFFYKSNDGTAWRGMFGLGIILPSIMILLALFVMPESPRWLASKGRDDEARGVLRQVYPPDFDVDAVLKDIKENIRKDTAAEHAVGWDVLLFPTPAFKRMMIVGIGVAISQQIVGIDAIQYFLTFILDEAGVKDGVAKILILISLGLLKLGFIVVAGHLFDTIGRRPLFFVSLGGMAVSLLILSFNFYSFNSPAIAILCLAMYLSSFSVGMGPGCWLIPAEIFPTVIRAKAMSIATFMNRVTGTLMASTFLSTANAMSWAGFFLLLAIICVICALFIYMYLPETKGRSLEDMSRYFAEITNDRSILDAGAQNAVTQGVDGIKGDFDYENDNIRNERSQPQSEDEVAAVGTMA